MADLRLRNESDSSSEMRDVDEVEPCIGTLIQVPLPLFIGSMPALDAAAAVDFPPPILSRSETSSTARSFSILLRDRTALPSCLAMLTWQELLLIRSVSRSFDHAVRDPIAWSNSTVDHGFAIGHTFPPLPEFALPLIRRAYLHTDYAAGMMPRLPGVEHLKLTCDPNADLSQLFKEDAPQGRPLQSLEYWLDSRIGSWSHPRLSQLRALILRGQTKSRELVDALARLSAHLTALHICVVPSADLAITHQIWQTVGEMQQLCVFGDRDCTEPFARFPTSLTQLTWGMYITLPLPPALAESILHLSKLRSLSAGIADEYR